MGASRRFRHIPWNKGRIGQKLPLKLREIWAIRVRLQLRSNLRDSALFNLAIDSKLRACDLLSLRVADIAHEDRVSARAMILQRKTRRPVQFEITELSRDAVQAWARAARLRHSDYVFPGRSGRAQLSTRQYADRSPMGSRDRIGYRFLRDALDAAYKGCADLSPHKESSSGATAARPHQAESTVRYLGIEVDDALEIAEQTEA